MDTVRQKKKRGCLWIFIGYMVAFCLFIGFGFYAFFGIRFIEPQEFIKELDSPNGKYRVTLYLQNGGATTDYAVLGVLTKNSSGKEKNIYFQYPCQDATLYWENNHVVVINGNSLNVWFQTSRQINE